MAADAWVLHDKAKEYMGDATIDLDADTFKVALASSASNAATTSVNGIASLTNEVSGNGYAQVTLGSVTWNESAGTVTFDSGDAVYTASGGSITARFAVLYDDTVTTPVADPIIAHCLLDNTPADVAATDGNTLTVQMNPSGIFTSS